MVLGRPTAESTQYGKQDYTVAPIEGLELEMCIRDRVYTAPLTPGDLKGSVLDNLEYRFNNEHPADYRHPSMSVSDIVAIKQDGKVSCHYCDSFGFQQIPCLLYTSRWV